MLGRTVACVGPRLFRTSLRASSSYFLITSQADYLFMAPTIYLTFLRPLGLARLYNPSSFFSRSISVSPCLQSDGEIQIVRGFQRNLLLTSSNSGDCKKSPIRFNPPTSAILRLSHRLAATTCLPNRKTGRKPPPNPNT